MTLSSIDAKVTGFMNPLTISEMSFFVLEGGFHPELMHPVNFEKEHIPQPFVRLYLLFFVSG